VWRLHAIPKDFSNEPRSFVGFPFLLVFAKRVLHVLNNFGHVVTTVVLKFAMVKKIEDKNFDPTVVPKQLIWSLLRDGFSVRDAAQQLQQQGYKVCKSTVQNASAKLKRESGIAASLLKRRQKKLSARAQRIITELIRFQDVTSKQGVWSQLQQLGYNVSYQTVRRTLKGMKNIKFVKPKKKAMMTADHRRRRLAWARQQLRDPPDWAKVYYADEKQWRLDGPTSRGKVLYDTRDPYPTLEQTGVSDNAVHVWGAFSRARCLDLSFVSGSFNSAQYISILSSQFPLHRRSNVTVLLHDRHPVHKSKETVEWMQQANIEVILLPAKSPDLNPIENLWSLVSRRVYTGVDTYTSKSVLAAAVLQAWAVVASDRGLRERLVDSMTRRLQAVVKMHGGPTKY
jgi:transposase